jgi:hypothetical protein
MMDAIETAHAIAEFEHLQEHQGDEFGDWNIVNYPLFVHYVVNTKTNERIGYPNIYVNLKRRDNSSSQAQHERRIALILQRTGNKSRTKRTPCG